MNGDTLMSDKKPENLARRRGFFASLGIAGAAAVAVATTTAKPAEAMTPPGTKGGKHYSESEHVKQYYRVNRY